MDDRRIMYAAVRGKYGSIAKGRTHAECIGRLQEIGEPPSPAADAQGFLTQHGHFVDRRAAWEIAKRQGQIVWHDEGAGVLMSEYLYPANKQESE